MLQIQKLTIQGFKSFISPQTIDFTFQLIPCFVFLTGENQVDVRLGANGVGKSSLFDALTWVLYGKTPIGLRASNIQNWKEKEPCIVSLEFTIKDKNYHKAEQGFLNTLRSSTEGTPVTPIVKLFLSMELRQF